MAVGAGQRLCGHAEALHVNGVTDAVARLGVPDAESAAGAVEKQVVVGVAFVGLQQVVVDVLRAELGANAVEPHHQGAGGVLGQGLVDAQTDLLAWLEVACGEVRFDELLRHVLRHVDPFVGACRRSLTH